MDNIIIPQYQHIVTEIGGLQWTSLDAADLNAVATAYYYFSIQFRENLLIVAAMFPEDEKLQHLSTEEFDTANLSPWPGVAMPGECMNHDEFMRRALLLSPLPPHAMDAAHAAGAAYLKKARLYPAQVRALSIASYEDGGLEATFRAMLTAGAWDTPALQAFRHFLVEHIRFDHDPDHGHGALARHLRPDERVVPLWEDFRDLLICAVPRLSARISYELA